jgi:hypothetical protein
MTVQEKPESHDRFLNGQTLLVATAYILPGVAPSVFGWLNGLLAIPVFCLFMLYGYGRGLSFIRNGVLLSLAVSILLKQFPAALFSLAMVPLGYSFYRSAASEQSEWQTAVRGTLVLAGSWLFLWTAYGAVAGLNPYQQLLILMDDFFVQSFEYYRANEEITAEALFQIEQAFSSVRGLIPSVLPGLLLCSVILTVWLNLVGSVNVVSRLKPDTLPWQKYSKWRLPDWLIWIAIADVALIIAGPGQAAEIAYAIGLGCGLLYFFQGLAVMIHLLDKWKLPLYLRIVIYTVLILQGYSLLFLTVLGIADVWIDFRQSQRTDNHQDD